MQNIIETPQKSDNLSLFLPLLIENSAVYRPKFFGALFWHHVMCSDDISKICLFLRHLLHSSWPWCQIWVFFVCIRIKYIGGIHYWCPNFRGQRIFMKFVYFRTRGEGESRRLQKSHDKIISAHSLVESPKYLSFFNSKQILAIFVAQQTKTKAKCMVKCLNFLDFLLWKKYYLKPIMGIFPILQ